jgi:hypothetical protein
MEKLSDHRLRKQIERLGIIQNTLRDARKTCDRLLALQKPAAESSAFRCALEAGKSFELVEANIGIAETALANFKGHIGEFVNATLAHPNAHLAGHMFGVCCQSSLTGNNANQRSTQISVPMNCRSWLNRSNLMDRGSS